jgi:hypothetical protein
MAPAASENRGISAGQSPTRIENLSSQSLDITAYRLAGLRIVSALPLPGLAPCRDEISIGDEIVIRRARVPASLSPSGFVFPNGQCNGNELLLNIPEVGKYLLRGGKEILVDQAPTSNGGELCGFLLGTVLGILCHQRGITPLHASAIDVTDGCTAFVGESGAGKSTLVAALAARGHEVIADDVCFLEVDNKGAARAWPGINRLRLWEDAMAALGCHRPGVEVVWRGWEKYFIPIPQPRNPTAPRRLRRVYQLRAAPDGDVARVTRLNGAAAVEVLIQNIYRLELAEYMGFKPAAFIVCAAVARDIPVFQFSRPMGFDALCEGVEVLEDHLRDLH